MSNKELVEVEQLELHYLTKYYHFLKFVEDELLAGFKTKEKIKPDWTEFYKSGISDFSVGAERIVYSLLNGKGIGVPNSAPVGADLFFEVSDAFVHIDLKTVGASLDPQKTNIGDFISSIFVGLNQNSYKAEILKNDGKSFTPKRAYNPALPYYYNNNTSARKCCLTYFIGILYDKDSLDILVMYILCMPNGLLVKEYGNTPLKAGKNLDKARFSFSKVDKFKLIEGEPSRIKVFYYNENMDKKYQDKLKHFKTRYSDF